MMSEERQREAEMEAPVRAPSRLARSAERDVQIVLDAETRKRIALQVEPLGEALLRPERIAYGRLQEDPSRSFTLRSPVAGFFRKLEDRACPTLGEQVAEGTPIGRLVPRFAPAERADLQARLSGARAEAEQAAAVLVASRAALARARTLNAEDKNVSDRALQETEARVKSDEIRQKSAGELAAFFEGALAGNGPAASLSIIAEQGGEVVELLARPGEAVESGQAILRLARYDSLFARVTLAAGERFEGKAAQATILPVGHEDRPLKGVWVASAPADSQAPGETHLLRVATGDLGLRPGLAVVAKLELPGEPRKGVLIPSPAVVRFGGKIWAYLEVEPGKFMRRELEDAGSLEKGWFVSAGFKAGDKVVIGGAGLLLSEELKSQIQVKEEGK
jgi:multidrug efflux pump subunit AcrA (membrane-fusion protein)